MCYMCELPIFPPLYMLHIFLLASQSLKYRLWLFYAWIRNIFSFSLNYLFCLRPRIQQNQGFVVVVTLQTVAPEVVRIAMEDVVVQLNSTLLVCRSKKLKC